MSFKSKKRRAVEDDELGNVIYQSFDNVSMAIDRAMRLWQSAFQSYMGQKFTQLWVYWTWDPISKTEAYIFLMENPMYKEMFFSCPEHERKCVLLTDV